MKALLITGVTGLCGAELARYFKAQGQWRVFTTSRHPGEGPDHVVYDLRQPLTTAAGGFPQHIDAVIHAAGVVDEADSGYAVIDQNVRLAFNIVDYARRTGVTSFINLSSVSVYGSPTRVARVDESVPMAPVTAYGLSKQLVEDVVAQMGEGAVVNLRLTYVLGADCPERYAVRRLFRQAQENAPIALRNGLTSRFQFIDTRDIATICADALEKGLKGNFNLGGDERPTVRETLAEILARVPQSRSLISDEAAPDAVSDVWFDNAKIRTALGRYAFIPPAASLAFALGYNRDE